MIDTYGAKWREEYGGVVSQGGYSSHLRTNENWVFPIPEKLKTIIAAPMLCAGLTAYSPLVRNGCGPGKKVGIIGLGGIGHFGVMLAKVCMTTFDAASAELMTLSVQALGAGVWTLSRSRAKEGDAGKLGTNGFIATSEENWEKPHKFSFDLILNCASSLEGFELSKYLSLLDVHGRFISVGLPEEAGQEIKAQDLLSNGLDWSKPSRQPKGGVGNAELGWRKGD
jgi:alcohol dehydrogenase (NADP+)